MNKRDLLTLVGPTVTRPVQDPLDVLLLDNQLYMLSMSKNIDKTSQSLLSGHFVSTDSQIKLQLDEMVLPCCGHNFCPILIKTE